MADVESQYERKVNSWFGLRFWTTFFCVIAANVLRDLGWLPYVAGFTIAYAVAMLVEYWIPPKPPISFPMWVVKIVSFLFLILLGMWLIPILLRRWVWTPLAFGVPTFILFLSLYWMPPLYPIKRRDALWKWLLFTIGFAIFYGWAMNMADK